MTRAVRSRNVLNSLYPANVRGRLFESGDESLRRVEKRRANQRTDGHGSKNDSGMYSESLLRRVLPLQGRLKLKNFMDSHDTNEIQGDEDLPMTSPIADLYPSTTVLFADISGFTAWSSEREPVQVFQLLVSGVRHLLWLGFLSRSLFSTSVLGNTLSGI